MILDEAVRAQMDGTNLYIGATTNFLFVGSKDEYERDIDGIDEKCRKNYERQLLFQENVITRKNFPDLPKRYKKLRKRKVREIYRKDTLMDRNGLVILIDGTETGNCWTLEDYKKNAAR